jgi:hypothetical protein
VAWRIVFLYSENGVALPLVKATRVEIESIQKDPPSTALLRFALRCLQELEPNTATTVLIGDPKKVNV